MVFEAMPLVNNEISKFRQALQLGLIPDCHFIGSHDKGEIFLPALFVVQRALEHGFSISGSTMVSHNSMIRKPFFELSYPVGQCREGSYYHERATNTFRQQMGNQGNTLNRLPQTLQQNSTQESDTHTFVHSNFFPFFFLNVPSHRPRYH